MCLAVPGKIVEITDARNGIFHSGKVDFGGVVRDVNLTFVPEAGTGDWVLVHAGCAINQMTVKEAESSRTAIAEGQSLLDGAGAS